MAVTMTTTTKEGHVDMVPSSFSFLKGLGAVFERVQWKKIHFFWKPAVGTTFGGLITVGFDWDWSGQDADRAAVSAYTPSKTWPLWADGEKSPLVLPPSKIMSQKWYMPQQRDWSTKGPGKLYWAVDASAVTVATVVGELWVDYTVLMSGTGPA